MILLIDADSLVFASCYKPRGEEGLFFEDIEDVILKFDETFQRVVNELSELYDVTEVLVFNDSRGNFRKLITSKYKANRIGQSKPPLLSEIHKHVTNSYKGIQGCGMDTDIYGRDKVMIVSIDKDYLQFPALIYKYNKKEVLDLSEYDALNNFYTQMIVGDAADNVNYFKGKGIKFAEKYYEDCDTKYQFTKKLYTLFKEKYKSKAKEKYVECYHLLKLRT
jgi:5'-3' exonuclease